MHIEITVYDGWGKVVQYDIAPSQTATDAEINEMIGMIEAGCPAYLAAALVVQDRPHEQCEKPRTNQQLMPQED